MTETELHNNASECVDYEFWSQMSGWTVAEAAALLLDIDPDRLPDESNECGTLGWKYRRLFRLLDRARKMDELSSPMAPPDFLAWASSNRLKPPVKLEATVRAGKAHRNWKTRHSKMKEERDELLVEVEGLRERLADDLNPRARQTLLKLVGGMARAKFKHFSGNRNSGSLIGKALDDVDWHVSDNSIRTYLSEADVLFDQDHPERK